MRAALLVALVPLLVAGCALRGARWENARQLDTVAAYEEFLAVFPEGPEAERARARIAELRGDAPPAGDAAAGTDPGGGEVAPAPADTEAAAWERARTGGLPALADYFAAFPEGRHVREAQGLARDAGAVAIPARRLVVRGTGGERRDEIRLPDGADGRAGELRRARPGFDFLRVDLEVCRGGTPLGLARSDLAVRSEAGPHPLEDWWIERGSFRERGNVLSVAGRTELTVVAEVPERAIDSRTVEVVLWGTPVASVRAMPLR